MSDIVSFNPIRALDRDGIPAPGALAYFFLSGTTTPQEVYTTAAADVAHPIPLEADSQGVFPPVFSAVALRCTVTDADGVTLPGFPVDPVAIIPVGSGASQVTFDPTGDIPETNVQAAIERVQANLVEPLLAGGIGVTGNAETLPNIDATNIASGAYRFATGTTGTFPAGITAAGGGTIRLWRETAAEAVMELVGRGRSATWVRTLTGSAWGAWQQAPLDSSATGRSILTAANAAAVATIIGNPTKPQAGSGAGQWTQVGAAVNTAVVLPSGGRWAFFVLSTNTTSNQILAYNVGVADGGTTIVGASPTAINNGFAWRVE